eukprot:357743-Chlamydomonas_euryale.AAC.3
MQLRWARQIGGVGDVCARICNRLASPRLPLHGRNRGATAAAAEAAALPCLTLCATHLWLLLSFLSLLCVVAPPPPPLLLLWWRQHLLGRRCSSAGLLAAAAAAAKAQHAHDAAATATAHAQHAHGAAAASTTQVQHAHGAGGASTAHGAAAASAAKHQAPAAGTGNATTAAKHQAPAAGTGIATTAAAAAVAAATGVDVVSPAACVHDGPERARDVCDGQPARCRHAPAAAGAGARAECCTGRCMNTQCAITGGDGQKASPGWRRPQRTPCDAAHSRRAARRLARLAQLPGHCK